MSTINFLFVCSARGVGVGSVVNQLKSPQQMLLAVSAVAAAMGRSGAAKAAVEELAQSSLAQKVAPRVFVE